MDTQIMKKQVVMGVVWSFHHLKNEVKPRSNICREHCLLYFCGLPLSVHYREAACSLMSSNASRATYCQDMIQSSR